MHKHIAATTSYRDSVYLYGDCQVHWVRMFFRILSKILIFDAQYMGDGGWFQKRLSQQGRKHSQSLSNKLKFNFLPGYRFGSHESMLRRPPNTPIHKVKLSILWSGACLAARKTLYSHVGEMTMLGADSTFSLNRDQVGREAWPPLQWHDQQTGAKDVALIAAFQKRFGEISNAEAVGMLPLALAQSLVVISGHHGTYREAREILEEYVG